MEFRPPDVGLLALLPTAVVAITAMVVLLHGTFRADAPRTIRLALLGLGLAALATVLATTGPARATWAGMLLVDRLAVVFSLMFIGATALSVLLATDHLHREHHEPAEWLALLLLSCCGMMLLASSGNLLMLFLGLETMSVALYILSGLDGDRDPASSEAALKYLLLGAMATGFLVYGMAFVFGATGSLDLGTLRQSATEAGGSHGFLGIGLALLTIGLGFKVALVPFHMWAPDVYEGAPTPVTAFMSVGAKMAGFAALVRVFAIAAWPVRPLWLPALWWLAVATMVVGNFAALSQTSLKRMLAFSGVAHAGYLLVGVVAANGTGVQGVVFYGIAYTLVNIGAFAVLLLASDKLRPELDDLRGLWRRTPVLAMAMALFLLSLAGMPPLAGFVGKWLLFAAAVEAHQIGLAVIGVLCSAVSMFYYLRVIVLIFMAEGPAEDESALLPRSSMQALWACVAGTLVASLPVGMAVAQLAAWAAQSAQ